MTDKLEIEQLLDFKQAYKDLMRAVFELPFPGGLKLISEARAFEKKAVEELVAEMGLPDEVRKDFIKEDRC